jgi:DNA-binding NtrC family response regulator
MERTDTVLALIPASADGEAPACCRELGLEWMAVRSTGACLTELSRSVPRMALLSFGVPGVDEDLAARVRDVVSDEGGGILLSSPEASLSQAVAAHRVGAGSLLGEPLLSRELGRELRRRLDPGDLVQVPSAKEESGVPTLAGSGPAMMEVVRQVARLGAGPATILVTGESGTGKELVARAIHWASPRRTKPFIAINCAAVPESLLESEFFGHERGAFTGAVARRVGRFERAHGGTLFLDEVGDMSPVLQAKLLRVLEEREFERVGGESSISVDVRVVAATNRSLEERIAEGHFREDLLYRLAVAKIHLPPLRERMEDLQELVLHFAGEFGTRHGTPVNGISAEAIGNLRAHDWPGNVRELRNVVERAVLSAHDGRLRSEDFRPGGAAPTLSATGSAQQAHGYPPTHSLEEVERDHIRRVLAHTGGGIATAAEILGIHRNTLTRRMRRLGIDAGSTDGGATT